MRILVIEDDREAADYLVKGLRESGYTVDHAADGKDGLFLALSEQYDAMVVDRMLPGPDGLTIVESVRKTGVSTPVLFLSALGEVEDRVAGLKAGGDDYLVKPYAFSELLARLEALLRRVVTPGEVRLKTTAVGGKFSDAMEKTYLSHEHGIERFLTKAGKVRGTDITVKLDLPAGVDVALK